VCAPWALDARRPAPKPKLSARSLGGILSLARCARWRRILIAREFGAKPLGTAAFRGYALVSVSGFELQKRRSGLWSLRPTFWCLVFAEPITFDDGGSGPTSRSGRISTPAAGASGGPAGSLRCFPPGVQYRKTARGSRHEVPGRNLLNLEQALRGPPGHRIPFHDRDVLVTACGRTPVPKYPVERHRKEADWMVSAAPTRSASLWAVVIIFVRPMPSTTWPSSSPPAAIVMAPLARQ
jgi:hypothetical protein